MTKPEFLQKLSQTPRDWSLGCGAREGILRRGDRDWCPIIAVAGGGSSIWPWEQALAIGLNLADAGEIIRASDANPEHHDRDLRAELIAACGLAPNTYQPDESKFLADLKATIGQPLPVDEQA